MDPVRHVALLVVAVGAISACDAVVPRARASAGGSNPVAWISFFSDAFTSENGTAPDTMKWHAIGEGVFAVDVQGSRLRLHASGQGRVGDSDIHAVSRPDHVAADMRIEGRIQIPSAGPAAGVFSTVSLRVPPDNPIEGDHYTFVLARHPRGVSDPPVAYIVKQVNGKVERISGKHALSRGATHFAVRAEVYGSSLRFAVRDVAAGRIPEGDWDIEITDSAVSHAGVGRAGLVTGRGAGPRDVYFDNMALYEVAAAEPATPTVSPDR